MRCRVVVVGDVVWLVTTGVIGGAKWTWIALSKIIKPDGTITIRPGSTTGSHAYRNAQSAS